MLTLLTAQMPRSWHDGGMFIGMHWAWWSFWILTALVVGWGLWKAAADGSAPPPPAPRQEGAEEELRRRYARGEIDDEEFARRLEVLRRS